MAFRWRRPVDLANTGPASFLAVCTWPGGDQILQGPRLPGRLGRIGACATTGHTVHARRGGFARVTDSRGYHSARQRGHSTAQLAFAIQPLVHFVAASGDCVSPVADFALVCTPQPSNLPHGAFLCRQSPAACPSGRAVHESADPDPGDYRRADLTVACRYSASRRTIPGRITDTAGASRSAARFRTYHRAGQAITCHARDIRRQVFPAFRQACPRIIACANPLPNRRRRQGAGDACAGFGRRHPRLQIRAARGTPGGCGVARTHPDAAGSCHPGSRFRCGRPAGGTRQSTNDTCEPFRCRPTPIHRKGERIVFACTSPHPSDRRCRQGVGDACTGSERRQT